MGLVRTFQLAASEFKRLTVLENLMSSVRRGTGADSLLGGDGGMRRYWGRDLEDAAVARASALLERFGLSDYANNYVGDLSGGSGGWWRLGGR